MPSQYARRLENNSLPTGGGDGDVLTKQSDADWDADWEAPGGGGAGSFNGGTITDPLAIEPIVAAGNDLLTVQNSAGGAGPFPLRVTRTPGGANVIQVGTQGFNGDTKFWADWDNDSDPTLEVGDTAGVVLMTGLPTTDPHVAGQLWADSTAGFVVKQSQG